MKFRTDFVTNSSSSGFVALHKLESETLFKLAEESGIDRDKLEEILEPIRDYGDMDFSFSDIYPDAADTVVNILEFCEDDVDDNDDEEEDDESYANKLEELIKKIKKSKKEINKDITIDIESRYSSSESGSTGSLSLMLEKGIGKYCESGYYGDQYVERDWIDNPDDYDLGETSVIKYGKIINKEPNCKDDFVFWGNTIAKYQGKTDVEKLEIPYKDEELIFDNDDIFDSMDGYYFEEEQKLSVVVIPDRTEQFHDNGALEEFAFTYVFPASLKEIDINCDKTKVIISAPVGSYTEKFAITNGYVFVPQKNETSDESVLKSDRKLLKEYGNSILDTAVKLASNIVFLTKYDLLDREQLAYLLKKTDNVEIKAILLEYSRKFSNDNAPLVNLELPENYTSIKKADFSGKTIVVTGELTNYTREGFKSFVDSLGGKVTGSVSKKTSYVVTNEPDSGTSKLVKAAELGIPVISEEEFMKMFNQ